MLNQLNNHYPVRYTILGLCAFGLLLSLFSLIVFGVGWIALLCFALLLAVGVYDLRQTRHAILRNYPIIGHLRFALEFVRPEIRQYFIEGDMEAHPSRARSARWCTSAPRACRTTAPSARNWTWARGL
jgi:hypothetical protein